jgi:hypothetical protein
MESIFHDDYPPETVTLSYQTYKKMVEAIKRWEDFYAKIFKDQTHGLIVRTQANQVHWQILPNDKIIREITPWNQEPFRR